MKTTLLKTNEIVLDKEVYPRAEWNWQTSYDYAQSMKSGAKFPPIIVAKFNRNYILVDGLHRMKAVEQINSNGRKKPKKEVFISAEILTGLSMKQIFEKAIETNISHGRQFSPYEKRKLIVKLGELGYNLDKISKMIHIPVDKMEQFTVGNVKTDFTSGKSFVLKSTLKGVDTSRIENVEDMQRPFSMDQEQLFKQINTLFENSVVDFNDEGITAQVKQLKKHLRGIKL